MRGQPQRQGQSRYKTKVCLYWLEGSCPYQECLFAHGTNELREDKAGNTPGFSPATNPRYKTRICKWWLRSGGTSCPHSVRCTFAHGDSELLPFSGNPDELPEDPISGGMGPAASRKPPLPGSTFRSDGTAGSADVRGAPDPYAAARGAQESPVEVSSTTTSRGRGAGRGGLARMGVPVRRGGGRGGRGGGGGGGGGRGRGRGAAGVGGPAGYRGGQMHGRSVGAEHGAAPSPASTIPGAAEPTGMRGAGALSVVGTTTTSTRAAPGPGPSPASSAGASSSTTARSGGGAAHDERAAGLGESKGEGEGEGGVRHGDDVVVDKNDDEGAKTSTWDGTAACLLQLASAGVTSEATTGGKDRQQAMHLKYLVSQDPASFPQSYSSLLAAESYRQFMARLRGAYLRATGQEDPQPEAALDVLKMQPGKPRGELGPQQGGGGPQGVPPPRIQRPGPGGHVQGTIAGSPLGRVPPGGGRGAAGPVSGVASYGDFRVGNPPLPRVHAGVDGEGPVAGVPQLGGAGVSQMMGMQPGAGVGVGMGMGMPMGMPMMPMGMGMSVPFYGGHFTGGGAPVASPMVGGAGTGYGHGAAGDGAGSGGLSHGHGHGHGQEQTTALQAQIQSMQAQMEAMRAQMQAGQGQMQGHGHHQGQMGSSTGPVPSAHGMAGAVGQSYGYGPGQGQGYDGGWGSGGLGHSSSGASQWSSAGVGADPGAGMSAGVAGTGSHRSTPVLGGMGGGVSGGMPSASTAPAAPMSRGGVAGAGTGTEWGGGFGGLGSGLVSPLAPAGEGGSGSGSGGMFGLGHESGLEALSSGGGSVEGGSSGGLGFGGGVGVGVGGTGGGAAGDGTDAGMLGSSFGLGGMLG